MTFNFTLCVYFLPTIKRVLSCLELAYAGYAALQSSPDCAAALRIWAATVLYTSLYSIADLDVSSKARQTLEKVHDILQPRISKGFR
jgi:hypothetical protein